MCLFFFNDTATTEIYTLSLHDALPICFILFHEQRPRSGGIAHRHRIMCLGRLWRVRRERALCLFARTLQEILCFGSDRKSTRLNSSHANISYAVFCLKKKKNQFLYTE